MDMSYMTWGGKSVGKGLAWVPGVKHQSKKAAAFARNALLDGDCTIAITRSSAGKTTVQHRAAPVE
jgi:hypothetical protein